MSISTKVPEPATTPAPTGMKTSTKWIIGIVSVFAALAVAAMLGVLALFPLQRVDDGDPDPVVNPEPVVEASISDGEWFGFVTVGRNESGALILGIDLADMLTGQAAHDAAVDEGIITEDEDLPNDFFIKNDESILELMNLSDDAIIEVVSADDVSKHIVITADQLEALYEGTYVGSDVYGVASGQPIAMDVTIDNGEITHLKATYLP